MAVSRGPRFVPEADGRVFVQAGGAIDPAEWDASQLFDDIRFHPGTPVYCDALAADTAWSSARTMIGFPAPAMYPPFL